MNGIISHLLISYFLHILGFYFSTWGPTGCSHVLCLVTNYDESHFMSCLVFSCDIYDYGGKGDKICHLLLLQRGNHVVNILRYDANWYSVKNVKSIKVRFVKRLGHAFMLRRQNSHCENWRTFICLAL